MDTYSIEANGDGAYKIRVTAPDGSSREVPDFPTWDDAQLWVNEQTEIAMKTVIASDGA